MENDKSCRYILALDGFMKILKDALTNHIIYSISTISPCELERLGKLAMNTCDVLYKKFSTTCKEYDTTWTRYKFFNTFSTTLLAAISAYTCNNIAFDSYDPHVVALHFFGGGTLKYIIKICDEQPAISVMHIGDKLCSVEYILTEHSISKNILTVIGSGQCAVMQLISTKKVTL